MLALELLWCLVHRWERRLLVAIPKKHVSVPRFFDGHHIHELTRSIVPPKDYTKIIPRLRSVIKEVQEQKKQAPNDCTSKLYLETEGTKNIFHERTKEENELPGSGMMSLFKYFFKWSKSIISWLILQLPKKME